MTPAGSAAVMAMNHIMFSPAFAQLVAPAARGSNAAPLLGGQDDGPRYCKVMVPRRDTAPLMFQGALLVEDDGEAGELRLYETSHGSLVCLFDPSPALGGATRRLFEAASPDELARAIADFDPLILVDVNVPDDSSAQDTLRVLHLRIAAVRSALMRLSDVLNVDVSSAVQRLAALCDGDQTWLQ